MKKLIAKLRKKDISTPSRITNETVAEHRERILAGGRRFKYPVQYARHRLVFNTIIISIVAVIVIVALGWWQLYPSQNTSTFIYSVTKVLPLPVASVDGQSVLYSDYLMKYRGSVYYLEQKEQISLKSDDGKRQVEYVKQHDMQEAVAESYAVKLAKKLNISVSDAELESSLRLQRQSSDGEVSRQTQDASNLYLIGWSSDEYRHRVKSALLRQKVAYAVDDNALKVADLIKTSLKADSSNLPAIATAINASGGNNVAYGASGWVPKINQDGGLASAANKLERGKTSSVIKSTAGDGYYFVRLVDSNDSQVSYEYIQVPLTTFEKDLESIKKNGKIVYYISIPDTAKEQ
ncbi:SurA N-terminal domain-containing protein [Candidatus Saccharibacteria bacterium]|nr:SurA N-terminal domain-containing protein [Candidatus Saccharibacteria bacterium]